MEDYPLQEHNERRIKKLKDFYAQFPTHIIVPIHPKLRHQESLALGMLAANIRNPHIMAGIGYSGHSTWYKVLGYLKANGYVFKLVGSALWYEVDKFTIEQAKQHANHYYKESRNIYGTLQPVRDSNFDVPAAKYAEVFRLDDKWTKTHPLPKEKKIVLGKGGISTVKHDSKNKQHMLWHDLLNTDESGKPKPR